MVFAEAAALEDERTQLEQERSALREELKEELAFNPQISDPESKNPIVLSTVITEDPTETLSLTLVLGDILNTPSIKLLSLYPANN